MGATTTVKKTAALSILLGLGVAWAASGNWDDARTKADDFKRKADEVHRLAPEQTRKVVEAICEANDDDRKSAGDRAASDARSRFADKYNALERSKKDALDALDRVEHDDALKDKRSDASRLSSDIKSRWDKISENTRGLRDGRPAALDWMISHGESARRDHRDRCTAKDVSINGEKAECVMVNYDGCTVVAMTADNYHAIDKGKDRAKRAASALDAELKKSSNYLPYDLKKCKKVESRVDCYKLCPDIDDDARVRETSARWRERC